MSESVIIDSEIEMPKLEGLTHDEQLMAKVIIKTLGACSNLEVRGAVALLHSVTGYIYDEALKGLTPDQGALMQDAYAFFTQIYYGNHSNAAVIEEHIIERVTRMQKDAEGKT